MKFKPLRDYVIVLPIERKLSDILIVKNTETFNQGEVVVVGPGKNGRPLDVKPGDKVHFTMFPHTDYIEDGVKYKLIQEADIACIYE